MLTGLRNMPRTVWLIGAISLVNDSASEMLYPLIPLYLSSVLLAMEMPYPSHLLLLRLAGTVLPRPDFFHPRTAKADCLSSAEWCGLATLRHASCLQQIPLHGGTLFSGKLIQSIFAAPS